uniref:HAUS augmin-like complex subunit 6 N-terminal domain-containing protein n=1 Tax=Stomoxys calcitrans TaxID=35570 RepID=A0A1I8P809_STOCA
MDRTIIAPYRAEEKELSLVLYKKLQGLILLHPASEDFKKCLSDEMFVKPNQQAFFNVMHYLFRLLDPNEFRKRFYWPITDKRAESNFRTSTVEYLKHLNEKHQLNWNNIKSYLVVMPGGMKFISFLLDFVHFIITELIKQKEKQLNLDSGQHVENITEESLQKMCRKDSVFKEMSSQFLINIDVISNRYMEKIQMLTQQFEELADTTKLSADLLIDEKFLNEFEGSNEDLFERYFAQRTQNIKAMEESVFKMKESMDRFYAKESGFKCDVQKISQQLRNIRDNFSIDNITEDSLINDDGVNINTLIKTFNCIYTTIQSELSAANKRPQAGLVKTRLYEVQKDLKQIESQMTDFLVVIKSRKKKRQDDTPSLHQTPIRHPVHIDVGIKRNLENSLLLKYVSTPPIKLELQEGHHGPSRLSLVDSKAASNTSAFNSFLAPSRTARITRLNCSLAEQSMVDLNVSMNKSKLIDPMQLLRSISKENSKMATTPKSNLSSLSSRWKERQSLLTDRDEIPTIIVTGADSPRTHIRPSTSAEERKTTAIGRKSLFSEKDVDISSTSILEKKSFATSSGSPTIIQSPFTPFNSNDRTRISRTQIQLFDTNSFTGASNLTLSSSRSGIKKICALKKVQNDSMNFANLSTSPSGRLEPLVTAEDFEIPKLRLNDKSLLDQSVNLNKSSANETSNPFAQLDFSLEKQENNDEVSPTTICDKNSVEYRNHIQEEEEALFNISDSVLNDVTL